MNFNTFGVTVDGIFTDIVVGDFQDKILVCITQTEKFGSILRVDREIFQATENQENVFNIRTLFGKDNNEDHLLVRILAEKISTSKPIIFVINLKNYSRTTIQTLSQVMKEKVC